MIFKWYLSVSYDQELRQTQRHHLDIVWISFANQTLVFTQCHSHHQKRFIQWVDLRENPQETIDFPTKYGSFL